MVNAVYHRSYEEREPIEVRINPDCIEILSFPGPDPSIRTTALNADRIVARRYRNRRVGDFLKELKLTEGRGTGIPKIRRALAINGSSEPYIDTDEARSYFLIRIPIHPDFVLPATVTSIKGNRVKVKVRDGVESTDTVREGGRVADRSVDSALHLRILAGCGEGPCTAREIASFLGYEGLTNKLRDALRALREGGLLAYTIPEKRNSRLQRYVTTPQGLALVGSTSRSQSTPDSGRDPRTDLEMELLSHSNDSPRSARELSIAVGHLSLTNTVREALRRLRGDALLDYTIPEKPNSRLQRYTITPKGRDILGPGSVNR